MLQVARVKNCSVRSLSHMWHGDSLLRTHKLWRILVVQGWIWGHRTVFFLSFGNSRMNFFQEIVSWLRRRRLAILRSTRDLSRKSNSKKIKIIFKTGVGCFRGSLIPRMHRFIWFSAIIWILSLLLFNFLKDILLNLCKRVRNLLSKNVEDFFRWWDVMASLHGAGWTATNVKHLLFCVVTVVANYLGVMAVIKFKIIFLVTNHLKYLPAWNQNITFPQHKSSLLSGISWPGHILSSTLIQLIRDITGHSIT